MKNMSTLSKFLGTFFLTLIVFSVLDALTGNTSETQSMLIISFAITWALDRDQQKKEPHNGKK